MKPSFAIIGPKNSPNTQDLCKEIGHLDHPCTIYSIKDISINVTNIEEHPFFHHDIYIFRGYNKSISFARSLATILHAKNKTIIDKILYTSNLSNKLQESILLKTHHIPQPSTFYARSLRQWEIILKKIDFPIVIKPVNGQQGKGIYKSDFLQDALKIIAQDEKNVLAQKYIHADGDIRIFIINNIIIGAIKRFVVPGDFRSNASLGAKTCIHHLSQEEETIAMQAHAALGYDISGVDMIVDSHGKPFVLEVNHTPQWQAFKNTTNTNPAELIIKYSLACYEKDRIL